jgi:VIT1/CCC1 family predicted Fe2+/Mn2+ transporter
MRRAFPPYPPNGDRAARRRARTTEGIGGRLNALRAAVLGANDGIVSVAGIVMGVAGATSHADAIFVAGVAGLVAGALSMAAGEYVSVSTQRDTERALLDKERRELAEEPEEELAELAGIYREKGLSEEIALEVAVQLTAHDALGAHAEAELGIDPDDLTNPWQAAFASMARSPSARLLPLLTITVVPTGRADRRDRGGGDPGSRADRVAERRLRRRAATSRDPPQRGRGPSRDGGHLPDRQPGRPGCGLSVHGSTRAETGLSHGGGRSDVP